MSKASGGMAKVPIDEDALRAVREKLGLRDYNSEELRLRAQEQVIPIGISIPEALVLKGAILLQLSLFAYHQEFILKELGFDRTTEEIRYGLIMTLCDLQKRITESIFARQREIYEDKNH